ncbi:hypothetical protein PLESTB_000994800 [Pleodorina starrii]|uniref:Uncharacterized protein n=1 Tax=Pleodorina starrii TaxID=330485 RepID=A0A9W6BPG2_9CHLO|nr:hypothetical protein PLESTM_001853800 [Pleodorina starrii]GLC55505.1 hypothetical protein PLESTB_000994800 [Pleodorina starrii]GLC76386.1 hypothetical protein PLESTF_001775000 [Pleodorina starrii]
MSGPPPVRIVLWNDGGEGLASCAEDEEQQEVLRSYAKLVSETIDAVLGLPQFRHVDAVEAGDAAEGVASSLSIGFDDVASDSAVDLDKLRGRLDIPGLLLGCSKLPEDLADVAELVVTDEEQGVTELHVTDEALAKEVNAILKRARVLPRYESWFKNVEEALSPALDSAAATVEMTETPMDPFDVLQLLIAQLVRVAGVSPPPPSLLRRGGQLVGRVFGAPRAALQQATKRLGRAQRLWWRLEDVVVDGSKLALKVALKAARPVLVGLVLHRVLQTLDRSRSLEVQLSRMTPEKAVEHYYRTVLGPDWREQFAEDMRKAVQDVNDGLVTDEINQEKRRMSAAQMRRLEVEEWDKQRMKNFYLASFGGLRWFDQVEAALHNPMFIESRGWTDPVQNWVGENRTYEEDLAGGKYVSDVGELALRLKESELGRRLSDRERAAMLSRGAGLAGGVGLAGEGSSKGTDLAAAALEAGSMLAMAPRKTKS